MGHSQPIEFFGVCRGDVMVVAPNGLATAHLEAYVADSIPNVHSDCRSRVDLELNIVREEPAGLDASGQVNIGVVRATVDMSIRERNGQDWSISGLETVRTVSLAGHASENFSSTRRAILLAGRAAIDNAVRTVNSRHLDTGAVTP